LLSLRLDEVELSLLDACIERHPAEAGVRKPVRPPMLSSERSAAHSLRRFSS
jgi:hypothetical protein